MNLERGRPGSGSNGESMFPPPSSDHFWKRFRRWIAWKKDTRSRFSALRTGMRHSLSVTILELSASILSPITSLFSLTDEQAMWRVQMHDDPDAFARLVRRWEGPIQRLCTHDRDLHRARSGSETFARLFAHRRTTKPEDASPPSFGESPSIFATTSCGS